MLNARCDKQLRLRGYVQADDDQVGQWHAHGHGQPRLDQPLRRQHHRQVRRFVAGSKIKARLRSGYVSMTERAVTRLTGLVGWLPSALEILLTKPQAPWYSMYVLRPLNELTLLNTKVRRWARLWRAPGLPNRVSVTFSERMQRSLGRCVPRTGAVRLNARVLGNNPALLEEVLCHELAHVAIFQLHGPKVRPHGQEWGALIRAAGFEPRARARLNRDVEAAEITDRAFYEHRCPVCHTIRLARRPVRAWRCAECFAAGLEGKLVIERSIRRRT